MVVAAAVGGCGNGASKATEGPAHAADDRPAEAAGCAAEVDGEPMKLQEGTNPTLSGMDCGVGNIFARELADERGVVAQRTSAQLSIHDPASGTYGKVEHLVVYKGSRITIGGDRYCVIDVLNGDRVPGWVIVGKL